MIVTESGRSGERNAYRSVLSAEGSSAMSGASRWLDATPALGPGPTTAAARAALATVASPTATVMIFFIPRSCFR